MGTRSLVEFIEGESNVLATIYQQYDGYPEGVGRELADFLASGTLVNGIPMGATERMFNGPGCLAAQFIAQFKIKPGGLYLEVPGTRDVGEEYIYQVHIPRAGEGHYVIRVTDAYDDAVYSFDSVEGFAEFCQERAA